MHQLQQKDYSMHVQRLQEELIELRQNRMMEIEELRLQYELEVAEARKGIDCNDQSVHKQCEELERQNEFLEQELDETR